MTEWMDLTLPLLHCDLQRWASHRHNPTANQWNKMNADIGEIPAPSVRSAISFLSPPPNADSLIRRAYLSHSGLVGASPSSAHVLAPDPRQAALGQACVAARSSYRSLCSALRPSLVTLLSPLSLTAVITYINRQSTSRRKLKDEDHLLLMQALYEVEAEGHACEYNFPDYDEFCTC